MPKPTAAARRYWLFKSEPDVYPFAQLQKDRRTEWQGVRNYQARNLLRDDVQVGDGVLFYHSRSEPMAIVGVAKVVKAGHADCSAFDPRSEFHDDKSDPSAPTWFAVDIAPVQPLPAPLTRAELGAMVELQDMMLLRRGARLSIQPVTPAEWRAILRRASVQESW